MAATTLREGHLSRRVFLGGSVALAAVGLSGCSYMFHGAKWRQKLSLTAYTPEGEVSASSVSSVVVPGRNVKGHTQIAGEALHLDLGSGRSLYALLDHNLRYLVPRAFLGFSGSNTDDLPSSLDYASLEDLDDVWSVPLEFSPKLVTFISPKQPLSIRELDPGHLDSFFGVGFGLKSMTIEVTKEDVTDGQLALALDDEFFKSWESLRQMQEGTKKAFEYKKSPLSALTPADFKRGVEA